MTSVGETIAAMAMSAIRLRHPAGAPAGRSEIEAAVRDCARVLAQDITPDQIAMIVAELETRLVVKVGKATTLVDEKDHVPWYFGDRKNNRRFFKRYADFLLQEQGWPPA